MLLCSLDEPRAPRDAVKRDPARLDVPPSLAIAGIYGYIGQRIYQAALDVGVPKIYGFDPGRRPADFPHSDRLTMVASETRFYGLDAALFHIATHPDQREGVYRLLRRGRHVNVEKPMSHPAHPNECDRLRMAARNCPGTLLFDFVEVFNPRSFQIRAMVEQLRQYPDFRIARVLCERSKDRECRQNPRNRKVMVPIQYQETAHCLALLLFVIDRCASFADAFPQGASFAGRSAPYDPPNPEDYRYGVVDGKLDGEIHAEGLTVALRTDFKRRGTAPSKCFRIDGFADGRDFRIEAVYGGGVERVLYNGEVVAASGAATRHQDIVRQSWAWHRDPPDAFRPDAEFAWLVFGLSAVLWASCHEGREIRIDSEADLRRAMQSYPDSVAERGATPEAMAARTD